MFTSRIQLIPANFPRLKPKQINWFFLKTNKTKQNPNQQNQTQTQSESSTYLQKGFCQFVCAGRVQWYLSNPSQSNQLRKGMRVDGAVFG